MIYNNYFPGLQFTLLPLQFQAIMISSHVCNFCFLICSEFPKFSNVQKPHWLLLTFYVFLFSDILKFLLLPYAYRYIFSWHLKSLLPSVISVCFPMSTCLLLSDATTWSCLLTFPQLSFLLYNFGPSIHFLQPSWSDVIFLIFFITVCLYFLLIPSWRCTHSIPSSHV